MNMYDYIEEIRKRNPEIRLDIGQPDLPVDERIIEATVEALRAGKTRYTSAYGITELRQRLAEKHHVSIDEVMVTAGGKFPIYAALKSCTRAALIHPGWPAYGEVLASLKKPHRVIHTTFEDSFTPSFEVLDKTVDLVVTNYPNNPTGITLPKEKMKELVDLCNDCHITLLADEIYCFISYNDFVSFQDLDCENLIYIGSFSKEFSMTGFRIGYVISNPEVIRAVYDFQVHSITCPAEFAQYAALKALTLEKDISEKAKKIYTERKNRAEKGLKEIGMEFIPCHGTFYEFPRVPGNSEEFCRELLNRGVSVIPGIYFGDYPEHFRLSLVSDNLEEAVRRMKDVLDRRSSRT